MAVLAHIDWVTVKLKEEGRPLREREAGMDRSRGQRWLEEEIPTKKEAAWE